MENLLAEGKKCNGCYTTKPLEDFYKGNGKFGKSSRCKECVKKGMKALGIQRRNRINVIFPENKTCSRCDKQKEAGEFHRDLATEDGLRCWCKQCCSKFEAQSYSGYKGDIDKKVPKDKLCGRCGNYKINHDFSISRSSRDGLTYICKQCASELAKQNRLKINKYFFNRYKNDPIYRIIKNLRRRMKLALDGEVKSAPSIKLLGISGKEVVEKLTELFWPGMTKENDGSMKWVVDHIIPVDHWDKTDPNWQFKCFHWTNLQPLWEDDNGHKASRLDWAPIESRHELPGRLKP